LLIVLALVFAQLVADAESILVALMCDVRQFAQPLQTSLSIATLCLSTFSIDGTNCERGENITP